MNPVDVDIGARIRAKRERLGVTEEALAKHLGVEVETLRFFEEGRLRVGIQVLFDAAFHLGVPVRCFFENLRRSADQPDVVGDVEKVTPIRDIVRLLDAFRNIANVDERQTLIWLAEKLANR